MVFSRRLKFLIALPCAALAILAGSAPLYAVCGSPIAVSPVQATALDFATCGKNAIGQYWYHQNAVWNRVAANGGHDSGALNGNVTCTNCPSPGTSYRFVTDWGNAGADGCPIPSQGGPAVDNSRVGSCDISGQICTVATLATDCNAAAGDTTCLVGSNPCTPGAPDLGPTDLVIAGQDVDFLGSPILSRAAFGSIDLNECKQQYDVGQLAETVGAPPPSACQNVSGSDCNRIGPQISCGPVPNPQITSTTGTNPLTVNLNLPAQTGVPYVDDCNVAASADVNCHGPCAAGSTRPGGVCRTDADCGGVAGSCPNNGRNLNAGRVLMVRRGACNTLPTNEVAFYGISGPTFIRTELWHPAITGPTNTDANYDGFSDPGTATPNPITLRTSGAQTTTVTVAAGAGRCMNPATGEYHGICITANAKQNNPCDGAVAPSNNLVCGACVGGTAAGVNCINNTPCAGGTCVGGTNPGAACTSNLCVGGGNPGVACTSNAVCTSGGICNGSATCTGGGTCSTNCGLGQCSGCTTDANCAGSTVGQTQCANCLYFGLAAAGDQFPNIASTPGATPWIAPYVSMNRAGVNISGVAPVPATDRVLDLSATKSVGKVQVSWNTSAELNTSGFRILGQKKLGDKFEVSSGLIAAEGGTDGLAHHYSIELGGGDLKGASRLYVVVVHPSGPDETFGPANL